MAVIIFDFDGTIADSFDYVFGFLARRSKKGRLLSEREKAIARGVSMGVIARRLNVPLWQIPALFLIGRFAMRKRMKSVSPHGDLPEVIKQLHADGHRLYIVSSNSAHNIKLFLKFHGLNKEFIKIYGNVGLLGKKRKLKKLRRRSRIRRVQSYYIGDEARDIKAARKAGLKAVAVTWGYSSRKVLTAQMPDYIVDEPRELQKLFK